MVRRMHVVSTGLQPRRTETSIDAETAELVVAVAQVDIFDAEYAIIYSGIDITLRRLRDGGYAFPNLELKVRTFIRK